MADLAVLKTAKSALQEGLITESDYNSVKIAFLKAQQIKAGTDAGFIREEEYADAKRAFLHALEFTYGGSPSSSSHGDAPGPSNRGPSAVGQATAPNQSANGLGKQNIPTPQAKPISAPPPSAPPPPPMPPGPRPIPNPAPVNPNAGPGANFSCNIAKSFQTVYKHEFKVFELLQKAWFSREMPGTLPLLPHQDVSVRALRHLSPHWTAYRCRP